MVDLSVFLPLQGNAKASLVTALAQIVGFPAMSPATLRRTSAKEHLQI